MSTKQNSFITFVTFLFLVVGVSAQKSAGFTLSESDREAINEMFENYSLSFGERDYVELRGYLLVPFISFLNEPVVFENLDDVIQIYVNLRQALEELDYDHSKIVETRITALTSNRAFVKKTYHRFKKDGTLLQERAFAYIVSKDSGKWKIYGILGKDLLNLGKVY